MKSIFNRVLPFSILFFFVLTIDIVVKLYFNTFPLRYITKPLVLILLVLYYVFNHNEKLHKNYILMLIALGCFLAGDFLLIEPESTTLFGIGMVFFILGKIFYAIRFSNQRDFQLSRLLPFLCICFLYILFLMNLIYDNLNGFFFPVLIYFFASIIVLQLAFLRKDDVNGLSYYLVFLGMLISMGSDSITAVKTFYVADFAFEKVTIMLCYGISQYLVVMGIVKEVKQEEISNVPLNIIN